MIFKAVNEESDDDSFIVVSNSNESVYSENGSEVIEIEVKELSNLENPAFLEEGAVSVSHPRIRMRNYQSHKSFIAKKSS